MAYLASIMRAAALSAGLALPSLAQEVVAVSTDPMPPISRAVLQKLDLADTGYEASLVLVDFAPNGSAGRHSHPVAVAGYVIYGSVEVEVDGGAKRRYAAGESFTVPANTVHDERAGAAGAKIVASFVVPAGEPLATPVN